MHDLPDEIVAGAPDERFHVLVRLAVSDQVVAHTVGVSGVKTRRDDFARRAAGVVATLAAFGATDVRELWLADAVAACVSRAGAFALAGRADVSSIEISKRVRALHQPGGKDERQS